MFDAAKFAEEWLMVNTNLPVEKVLDLREALNAAHMGSLLIEANKQEVNDDITPWAVAHLSADLDRRWPAGGNMVILMLLKDAAATLRAQARRIMELEEQQREDHANINLKADFIEATLNDMAASEES